MIHLELKDDEAALLKETLDSALKNLSYEIADTDTSDFRDQLKARREVLARISEALGAAG